MKCLNCDMYGHSFQYCIKPIKSFGIIAYRQKYSSIEFLLIKRKNTIGYTDFMRGRYNSIENLIAIVEEMSEMERISLKTCDFDTLWDALWYNHSKGIYINERTSARNKFNKIDIKSILNNVPPSKFKEPEYGFPKGRKNLHEKYEECARREFEEETGITSENYEIDHNIDPVTETFIGSDGKKYSHIYYIAKVSPFFNLKNALKTDIFLEEISELKFAEYKDAYKCIRSYDTQKRYTLTRVYNLLKKRFKNA